MKKVGRLCQQSVTTSVTSCNKHAVDTSIARSTDTLLQGDSKAIELAASVKTIACTTDVKTTLFGQIDIGVVRMVNVPTSLL